MVVVFLAVYARSTGGNIGVVHSDRPSSLSMVVVFLAVYACSTGGNIGVCEELTTDEEFLRRGRYNLGAEGGSRRRI